LRLHACQVHFAYIKYAAAFVGEGALDPPATRFAHGSVLTTVVPHQTPATPLGPDATNLPRTYFCVVNYTVPRNYKGLPRG